MDKLISMGLTTMPLMSWLLSQQHQGRVGTMIDTVWTAEPKIFTLWPCVDFCPKIHKTAFL